MLEEVKCVLNFLFNLVWRAENVSVVLLEAPYSNQTTESTRDFVSVEHAEVSIPQRQVSVRVNAVFEHHAVSRAVHGLETMASVFAFEQK